VAERLERCRKAVDGGVRSRSEVIMSWWNDNYDSFPHWNTYEPVGNATGHLFRPYEIRSEWLALQKQITVVYFWVARMAVMVTW
jgi:hypothetical protein